MTRPWLLLDVDGVLNVLGHGDGGERWQPPSAPGLCLAVASASRLTVLSTRFSLVWATSWGEEANEIISPLLSLPSLPVVPLPVDAPLGVTWKLPGVKRWVRGRPFAWVDDEIGDDAHRWAAERPAPSLLIDVDPQAGLTQEHVEMLVDFADKTRRT